MLEDKPNKVSIGELIRNFVPSIIKLLYLYSNELIIRDIGYPKSQCLLNIIDIELKTIINELPIFIPEARDIVSHPETKSLVTSIQDGTVTKTKLLISFRIIVCDTVVKILSNKITYSFDKIRSLRKKMILLLFEEELNKVPENEKILYLYKMFEQED